MCITRCTIIRICSMCDAIIRHRIRTRAILTTRTRNRLLIIASDRLIHSMTHIMRLSIRIRNILLL